MKLKTTTTSCSLFVAVTFLIISSGLAKIMCPERVIIEEGGTVNVSCDTSGRRIELVYWYFGDPAISSPILRLENGKPGGTEHGKGHYSITSSGGMIITNATIEDETVYTTLLYFQDETKESMSITVNVTISPPHSCPVINECIPCKECSMAVNDTGKLTCSITGARPMIPLKFTIETQEGVRILEHPPFAVKDVNSDAWNSSVEVSYEVSSCNQEATLQCKAEDIFNLLTLSQSSVRIYTANCTNGSLTFIPAKSNNTIVVVAVVCGIFVISGMFLFTCTCLKVQRKSKSANGVATNSSDEEHLPLSKVLDVDAQELASLLKEKYKESFPFDSSPNKEGMTAAKVFAACNYKVYHSKGGTSVLPSDKLFKNNGIKNESRVLISGGPRFWKTILTKQFVQQWIDDRKNDFILLYIRKSEIKANVKLVDILAQEASIDRTLMAKSIKNSKCILIIDGLDSTAFNENETKNEQRELSYKNDMKIGKDDLLAQITFSDFFKAPQDKFPSQMQIWVLTGHRNPSDGIFTSPYAKVNISDVADEKQFYELVEKVYKQCSYSSGQLLSEKHDTGVNTKAITHAVGFQNEQSTVTFKADDPIKTRSLEFPDEQSCSEIEEAKRLLCDETKTEEINHRVVDDIFCQHVKEFLKKNKIYQQFKETPFVLSLMVLITIQKYLQKRADFDDVNMTTSEELICKAVPQMQEAYFVTHGRKDYSETCDVDATLGRVAFHLISTKDVHVDKQNSIVTDYSDHINLAIEMGLIQFTESKNDSQPEERNIESSQPHLLKFVHPYIMFYFAAIHVVKNKEFYKALAEYDEHQSRTILKILVHLEKSSLKHLVGALLQLKMGDDVIDCLSEWENPKDVEEILTSLEETELQVSSLDRQCHRNALTSILRKCIDMQTKLESLVIRGNVPVPVLTSLELPVINLLTLRDREIQEMEFVSILQWLSRKEITLRFQNCKIEEKLSDSVKREIKTLEGTKVKTICQRDESDSTTVFNYKTATWKKKEAPMIKTIKDNLPTPSNLKKVLTSV